ncbi:MAG: hypothetical protein ACUVS4_13580 [Chloroflexaceae bacterium]
MAVQSRDLHSEGRFPISLPIGNPGAIAYLITGILALLAIYVLLNSVFGVVRTVRDDLAYGRPRTFHLTANVGRPEEVNGPTRLIAMNLDRQVVIVEIAGSDPNRVRTIPGPYLFGAGEDLTPVTMRLDDLNGDAAPDLIVQIKNEELVYLNRGTEFGLISAEERQQILQRAAGKE